MRTRREILGAAALAGARAIGAGSSYAPRLMVESYVWTQHFETNQLSAAEGYAKAFPACRRAGYTRIGLNSSIFASGESDEIVARLKESGLEVPVVFYIALLYDDARAEKSIASIAATAEKAKRAGATAANVNPWIKGSWTKRERKTDDELGTQARNIDRLGKELAARGIRMMLHNHDAEMTEDAREWRSWLRLTDPETAGICLDLDWVRRGGQDPMALLREAGSRLAGLHIRNTSHGVWMEDFGDGDIDYRPVAAYLRKIGFQGDLAVELAYEKETRITRTLEEDLRLSRIYTEKIFGLSEKGSGAFSIRGIAFDPC
jgi:inosose dehydratase